MKHKKSRASQRMKAVTDCVSVCVGVGGGADNRACGSPGRRVGHAVVRRWVGARVLGSALAFPPD